MRLKMARQLAEKYPRNNLFKLQTERTALKPQT